MNNTSSQAALRRLIIVIAVVVGILVYARGWVITDVSLDEVQDPNRTQSVERAMRELLSPNIFAQDYELEGTFADFEYDCSDQPIAQPPQTPGEPYVTLSATCGSRGDLVTIEGFNFQPNSQGALRWVPDSGQSRPLGQVDTDDAGYFVTEIEVPSIRGGSGIHQIEIQARQPVGAPYFSDTMNEVLAKMVETIYLALIATTLAVPISVVLSFFAARNLMKQIHTPLGNLLVAFLLLPIGWLIGAALLTPIGEFGFRLGTGEFLAAAPAIIILGSTAAVSKTNRSEVKADTERWRGLLMTALFVVAGVFVTGLLGGIGITIGRLLEDGTFSDLGYMFGTLGELFRLLMGVVAGLAGAFYLSSLGGTLTRERLRAMTGTEGHILGAVLGFLGGGLLLGFTAAIGMWAALLALLVPVVAATMASAVVGALYRRYFVSESKRLTPQEHSLRITVQFIAAVAVFIITFIYLDVARGVVTGRLPLDNALQLGSLSFPTFMLKAAAIGAMLGGVGGWLAGTSAQVPIGMTVYDITRVILNILRSIEPLIMGIVFVIWVGIGPFAGMLALVLHSIASLGKLYSEQTENIDPGPLEAMQATGATWLQTIVYGVVPQIVPPYVAFTLYRWDINVRMSTIIGFVGGGGIGFLLNQQINLLRYRDAGVAVLAIAVVVSILDYASATIRERMV